MECEEKMKKKEKPYNAYVDTFGDKLKVGGVVHIVHTKKYSPGQGETVIIKKIKGKKYIYVKSLEYPSPDTFWVKIKGFV